MAQTTQINPGMTLLINGKLFRVETAVKVTVPKGTPFVKTKLRNLETNEVVEKNFKPNQSVEEVSLCERNLEFLYIEGQDYLFLDIDTLDQIFVPAKIIGNKMHYLKEGIDVKASLYGSHVFNVELPQFLELMISRVDSDAPASVVASGSKLAVLETGAKIEVPPFVEVGDIIKVDTRSDEYIQRV